MAGALHTGAWSACHRQVSCRHDITFVDLLISSSHVTLLIVSLLAPPTSKGQPMSVAFDEDRSICLTGSEAEAVAVPIDASGRWLSHRIDLAPGEVVRIGCPRLLVERSGVKLTGIVDPCSWELKSGIELRSYSIAKVSEAEKTMLQERAIRILSAPVPYDPTVRNAEICFRSDFATVSVWPQPMCSDHEET